MKKNNLLTFAIPAYKESKYLEDCIKSVINQSVDCDVIITTSTCNDYILSLAKKYNIKVYENKGKKGIGYDFDFAINSAKTKIVTVAHQDDIYEKDYAKNIVDNYLKYPDSSIIFTDYYEIRKNKNVYTNLNLKIKRILLIPLRFKKLSKYIHIKRNVLRFGNAICCPAVSFIKSNIDKKVFSSDLNCNIDWYAWEKLSKEKGRFIFIHKKLMGHRIYNESTTSDIINDNKRTKEDFLILCKFWPRPIASIISKVYAYSEKSNNVK